MADWEQDVEAALLGGDQRMAAQISRRQPVTYAVILNFADPPAVGDAVGEVLRVDRAFRYAGRSFATGEPLEELLARRGRPLYMIDGLRWTAQDLGSVRTRMEPTVKLAVEGLAIAVSSMALLTGSIDVHDRVTAAPVEEAMGPAEVFVPARFPVEVTMEIEVRSGIQVTKVRYRRVEGWRYEPLRERPPWVQP